MRAIASLAVVLFACGSVVAADPAASNTPALPGAAAAAAAAPAVAGGPTNQPASPRQNIRFFSKGPVAPVARPVEFVELATGEFVRGSLLGLDKGILKLDSPLFGECLFSATSVARIGFRGPEVMPDPIKPRLVYRENERPVPGTLLGMNEAKIALDTPLGAVELARNGILAYAFSAPAPVPLKPGESELVLRDGGIVRGQAVVSGNEVALEHAILGTKKLPLSTVVAMKQAADGAIFLADLTPESVRSLSALDDKEAPEPWFSVTRGLPFRGGAVQEIRIEPPTTVRYRIEARPGTSPAFRALARPLDGARSAAILRVKLGEKLICENKMAPDSAPVPVQAAIAGGGGLTLEVDFGGERQFPCGVVLEDPVVEAGP